MPDSRKIAELQLDEHNANLGTDRGRKLLAESLHDLGAGRSILLDKEGRIIAGNKTVEGAREVGIEDVIIVRTTGDQLVAVQRDDLDLENGDGRARRLAYADNRIAEVDLEWDIEQVTKDIEAGVDIEGMFEGFEFPEPGREGLIDDDDVPEPEEAITKPGGLWVLGEHRLLCGDATKVEDVARLMDGEKAVIVTDPPYGVDYNYKSWNDSDQEINDRLFTQINDIGWPLVYFCGLVNLLREISRGPCKVLVWHKPWSMTHSGIGNGRHHWEPIIVRNIVKGAYLPSDVLVQNTDREPGLRDLHSCPKPVDLMSELVKAFAPDRAIYDPFLGSGSTLIACEKTNRRCYGMEIDPHYCDVIVNRWQQFTGKKAVREIDKNAAL